VGHQQHGAATARGAQTFEQIHHIPATAAVKAAVGSSASQQPRVGEPAPAPSPPAGLSGHRRVVGGTWARWYAPHSPNRPRIAIRGD